MKKQTTVAALGAIAKQLKKIAKELKRANDGADPLEEVYVLTEKGKELAEQHKDECEELSNRRKENCRKKDTCKGMDLNCKTCENWTPIVNTPSDEKLKAAVNTIKKYCASRDRCVGCRYYLTDEPIVLNQFMPRCGLRKTDPGEWRV